MLVNTESITQAVELEVLAERAGAERVVTSRAEAVVLFDTM